MAACEAGKRYTPHLRRALTARNRAILSVLIDTDIRRSELVGLRLGDVDREMRVLTVHRKGNRWQQVPISYEGFLFSLPVSRLRKNRFSESWCPQPLIYRSFLSL